MYRVLACLTNEHDWRLVVLAALVCTATIVSSFRILNHAQDARDTRRLVWLGLAGICTAAGIWATHFVAMLGYDAGIRVGIDISLMLASLLLATIATLAGYWIAAEGHVLLIRPNGPLGSFGNRLTHMSAAERAGAGGAIIGLGIAGMHYMGMQALIVPGRIDWDPTLAAATLVVGITLTPAALVTYRQLGPGKGVAAASAMLIAAICGVHFTAMGAATIIPDPTRVVENANIDAVLVAISVVGVTAFVLGAGLVAVAIEKLKTDLATHIEMLQAANGRVTDLNVELANNILKLKEAQDEIVRKGKLAQLGQLTATVAHEIRNPLGTVKTATYLVERKIKDKGLDLEAPIGRINSGIARCDKIITELLDFARSKAPTLKTSDVDQWVCHTVDEEQKSLPPEVRITFDLGLDGLESAFDGDRMRRVLINLLSNASEAMVGKGKAGESVTDNPQIHISTRRSGDVIELSVADNGPGITPENLARIREPLFTTKSFGVGLGVPAVEKILEQHGGGLRIETTPGAGATFIAWFPIISATVPRKAA